MSCLLPVPPIRPPIKRRRSGPSDDPGLYCADIEWRLCHRDAACGVRSSFGAMLATLTDYAPRNLSLAERKAMREAVDPAGGVEDGNVRVTSVTLDDRSVRVRQKVYSPNAIDPYHSGQCELASAPNGAGGRTAFARDRRLTPIWNAVPRHWQEVLAARYLGLPSDMRRPLRVALLSAFGELASAVAWCFGDESELMSAIADVGRVGRAETLDDYRMRTEALVRQAHAEWYRAADAIGAVRDGARREAEGERK